MSTENTPQTDEISLKEIIQKIGDWYRYLKTQWLKIAIAGLIGGVIGFFYAWLQPITFTAKTTFVVEDSKGGGASLGGLASLAGQFGVDVGSGSNSSLLSSENIILYFKTYSLVKEVLLTKLEKNNNKTIADEYARVYGMNKAWEANNSIGLVNFSIKNNSRLNDSLLKIITQKILSSNLSVVRVDKKASFIDVSVTMENEELAKIFCDKIIQTAVNRYVNTRIGRQKNAVDKLQARADSLAYLLNKKTISGVKLQTNLSTMDINPLYKIDNQFATEITQREKVLLNGIFTTVLQNLELAKFTLNQETPIVQVVDIAEFPLLKNKQSRVLTSLTFFIILVLFSVLMLIIMRLFKSII